MRNCVLWLAMVVPWLVDGGFNQHAQAHITSPGRQAEIGVLDAVFGIFSPSASGELSFVPTNTVPYVAGQEYGWFIKLKINQPTVKWREVFTLPAAPVTWGVEGNTEDLSISNDGKTSTIEQDVVPEEGLISNSWAIALSSDTENCTPDDIRNCPPGLLWLFRFQEVGAGLSKPDRRFSRRR